MKCYKCGSFLYDGEYCSNCGADVTVYREIVLKSNDFYNYALEYARDRNLSKAIEFLKLSLKLYKGNINSHNLLGLVYFETGEYTLGFAHWVISKNIQPENNLASIFLDQIQEDRSYFDAINGYIKKYNKAIEYTEQESYDLAEIQLKKLVNDENMHMVAAFQLSALLKMRKKKYAAARKILEKAQAIDAGNPTTIAYSTFINGQIRDEEKDLTAGELRTKRAMEDSEQDQRAPLSGDDVIIPKTGYSFWDDKRTTLAVLQILIGFLVGAALIFFIVVPAKTKSTRNEYASVQAELESQVAQLNEQLAEVQARSASVPEKTDDNGTDNADTEENQGNDTKTTADTEDEKLLLEAYEAYQNNEIVTCGELLMDIKDPDSFDAGNKILYDSISYIKDLVPDLWFDDAVKLFRNYQYEEALEIFNRVYEVANTTGESVYYIALCYYNLGDGDTAAAYFNEYIETYPAGPHIDECYWLLTQV